MDYDFQRDYYDRCVTGVACCVLRILSLLWLGEEAEAEALWRNRPASMLGLALVSRTFCEWMVPCFIVAL